ncbi:hypothetical protein AYK25_02440 [Thermoplasmatales archaeon SM1-50]|nr:MAG: hypothetical protein AYK25_02440 [Thermoplasmatales archaeon SM1-50]
MKKSRRMTNDAVVGVVTAILLTGIIVAVLSLVQTVYVPKIMEQREAEHMDKVAEQFASLSSVIADQAADETKGIPIATSITLGSKELPYLLSIRSYGTLEIIQNACSITINNATEAGSILTASFPINTITYSSANAYFLDQTYAYEAGAMIVSQIQGNLMMIRPSFVVDADGETIDILFDVVNISTVGQKIIASGYGTYPIQTEFHDVTLDINFTKVRTLTITTSTSNAWSVFLNYTMIQAGLNQNGSRTDYFFENTGQSLTIDFSLSSRNVNVFFRMIDIQAQIGPGWIE